MTIARETIDAIKACGFDVYLPQTPRPTWLYFSDGNRIGYLQKGDFFGCFKLSTVHIPNKQTGTGFHAGEIDRIDKQSLLAAFAYAPQWAIRRDRESVRKWPDIDQFFAKQFCKYVKESAT